MSEARCIESYVFKAGIGVLIELSAPSESMIRRDEFAELARDLAMHVASMAPGSVEDMLHQPSVRDPEATVMELIGRVAGVEAGVEIVRFVR